MAESSLSLPDNTGEFLFYQTEDGQTRIQVRLEDRTVWMTQRGMAELFQTTVPNINQHLATIYEEKELGPEATIKKYLIVQTEGRRSVQRTVEHYNLEAIMSVGYRVQSHRGTQFRQWATRTLTEYLAKGFVLDDRRLKEGRSLGQDYFDELLARIRDIRASERRFYQKIADIYTTSVDYDANAEITQTFYATVQNKLHWAVHGHTAAEIILRRANANKPNMGLTTWKNAPSGSVRKSDITVAKNYLSEDEINALNRIVGMYLDYAELQAEQKKSMYMADWIKKLDAFLQFNEQNILTHAGKISHELAAGHAETEFEKYEQNRRKLESTQPLSDFDKAIEKIKQLEPPPPKKHSKGNNDDVHE